MNKDKLIEKLKYFTIGEWLLWILSIIVIVVAFVVFKCDNYTSLIGSIIGVTSLIFNAKGNPIGQILIIVFSVFYGIISYTNMYYGEMITYLGMSAPMAVFSLISWVKNPYKGDKKQVKVNHIKAKEHFLVAFLTISITFGFYFILKALNTNKLIISTVSVATSFIAAYYTFRRSPLFALGYASNDIVLIIMWVLATLENRSYISMVICFGVFFINDMYSFINWLRIKKKQLSISENTSSDSVVILE